MAQFKALIIDDEPLAREIIRSYLKSDDRFELIGESSDGFEGFKMINELRPDVVFLDIMMPKLTGFEMLELIDQPPLIIFSTAHDEFAIKAFEQNAIDYLLKPYSQERFAAAMEKVESKLTSSDRHEGLKNLMVENSEHKEMLSRVAVKTGNRIQIVPTSKIRFLEAMDDYVRIHAEDGVYLKQNTMKYYESHLAPEDFIRIHRSYIVRVKEILRLEALGKDSHVVFLLGGDKLPVSRSGYTRLKESLNF